MMKSFRKPITALLLLALVLTTLLFGGCEDILINNGMHREECETYLNAMLAGDFAAAHTLTPAIPEEEHRAYFETGCQSFAGATSYELTQTGWNINTTNGVTTQTAAYQIVTDTGVTCQISLQTTDGVEGISYIIFRDSTAFIESTKNVWIIDIVLKAISVAGIAFIAWMIVDCARRKISKKALWIIVILLTFSVGFTAGESSFFTNFTPGILSFFSSLEAIVPDETISLRIATPLGALIYFLLRKMLSQKYSEKPEAQAIAASPSESSVPDKEEPESPKEQDSADSE